jgi:hypothetical protein
VLRIRSLVFALILASAPALAWHDRGHREIAYIAWNAMGAAQRTEIANVLRAHPRFDDDFGARLPPASASWSAESIDRWLLGQAATWPDLIQTLDDGTRRQYNRSRWHYINLVVWLTDADEHALDSSLEHNRETDFSAPLDRSMNVVQALKGNLAIWHDGSASDADRAIALCWILHLAADLHQPLHSVALFSQVLFPTGDRGGNDIDVHWGDEVRNLHAVWDGLPTDMADLSPSARTRRSIEADIVDEAAIDEWLYHHARLADMFVYTDALKDQLTDAANDGNVRPVKLNHEYLVAARSISKRQVNLAGHRIEALLRHRR